MDSRGEITCAQRTERIRELNDRLRTQGVGGRIFLTRAVSALTSEKIDGLMTAIAEFDAFTRDNDPHGEHDFGQVTVENTAYFWKIDYYDLEMEFGSPDPSDEAITRRVLTILDAGDL